MLLGLKLSVQADFERILACCCRCNVVCWPIISPNGIIASPTDEIQVSTSDHWIFLLYIYF